MKDRIPKYPGRVMITPVSGQTNIYDMVRADEPEEAGTPINKQSLLTDETAEKIGLRPGDNPTPNDAFYHLAANTASKTGDIRETTRTDLGSRWVLCNGDIVPTGEYPHLREVLLYNTAWRKVAPFYTYPYVRAMPKAGQWALIEVFENTSSNGKTAVLYDANTDTCTEIRCPIFSSEYSYGIFGLTYDGERYILGVNEDANDTVSAKVHLFTSTDLVNWTDAHQYTVDGYWEPYDLTFDGASILVAAKLYSHTNEYYEIYVYYTDKGLTTTKRHSGYWNPDELLYFSVLPQGYWTFSKGEPEGVNIYRAGTLDSVFQFYENGRIAFFSDKYWIGVPAGNKFSSDVEIYNFETAQKNSFTVRELIYIALGILGTKYLRGGEYDKNTNEWMLYITDASGTEECYIAYISADADPNDMTQYRVVQVESLPEMHNVQMAPDRSKMTEDNLLRDPNQKYLPSHDGDTYKYIYVG